MNNFMITTAFGLPGCRITKSPGVVRGITVRARSVIGSLAGFWQSLFGGNITIYGTAVKVVPEDEGRSASGQGESR